MRSNRAFSLVEVLVTVSLLGVLATIAVLAVNGVFSSAQDQKLTSDVETLNRGAKAFLASGGSLDGITAPADVLVALKQHSANAERVPGLSGPKIDSRMALKLQSAEETTSQQARAYWNPANSQFYIATAGTDPGIKEFYYDDSLAEVDFGEAANNSAFLYAESATWVWDYQDAAAPVAAGPSTVPTATPPVNTTPSIPVSPPGSSSSSATSLATPLFSIAGGSFPIANYNLSLSFTNPNPDGSSQIYYSIDYGNWVFYPGGDITIPPGSNVAAQAIALSGSYRDSSRQDEFYDATPAELLPPTISPSQPVLGLFTNRVITVTLNNPNDAAISALEYQIDGGGWQAYTVPFDVDRDDHLNGVTITARAIPNGSDYYEPSTEVDERLEIEPLSITGSSQGAFHSPSGESQMVTNLTGGLRDSYFFWGEASGSTSSPSWMQFNTRSFADITTNERFEMGLLDYYNGTIRSDTGANAVSLGIDLDITINGLSAMPNFDFDFALVNVPNVSDPWDSADFVRLAQPIAEEVFTFHGVQFKLKLEFGETTSSGLTQFNEFYVLEDNGATTRLYGTLIEVGSAPSP